VPSPDWHIRPLSADDSLEELTDLIHAAYAPHLSAGLRFVGTHQTVAVTEERLATGDAFVAKSSGRTIGTVLVRPPRAGSSVPLYRDLRTWSISQLAVAPEYIGRGLGRALHDTAVRHAVRHGARIIALDTASPAARLIRLYKSWGYRIVGRTDYRPTTNYESVLMARSVASLVGMPMSFKTDRLEIRRGEPSDAEPLFHSYTGNVEASRFLQRPPHANSAQTEAFLRAWSTEAIDSPSQRVAWVIEERANPGTIGVVVLIIASQGVAELHFGIAPTRWNRGIATEACRPVLAWLQTEASVAAIESYCDPENAGSARVLEKLGFLPVPGRVRVAQLPAHGPGLRRMQVYSYPKRQA
jgi:RimJ/RimL family protein N-acetyltransferase